MPEDHVVQPDESVSSIAYDRGFHWETIWNHGNNSSLKDQRKDPDVLLRGDILHIPDLQINEVSAATDKRHKFRKKGVPAKFVAVLLQRPKSDAKVDAVAHQPWEYVDPKPPVIKSEKMANAPFELYADNSLIKKGQTDGNGRLEVKLAPNAEKGLLIVRRGTPQEVTLELNFRRMDPITELIGVCKRLRNLGYPCPTEGNDMTPEIQGTLADFQRDQGLELTGELDDTTRNKVKELYGG